jgi:predicted outer membrane protein
MRLYLVLCCFFTLLSGCNQPPSSKPIAAPEDIKLVSDVYENAVYATKTSNEALTRSTAKETKLVADSMIAVASTIKSELVRFAGRRKITLPLDISASHITNWQALVKTTGWQFDKAFLQTLQNINTKEREYLESVTHNAKDAELRKIGSNLLNGLNDRLGVHLRQRIEERSAVDSGPQPVSPN